MDDKNDPNKIFNKLTKRYVLKTGKAGRDILKNIELEKKIQNKSEEITKHFSELGIDNIEKTDKNIIELSSNLKEINQTHLTYLNTITRRKLIIKLAASILMKGVRT